jgi:hypothetical protein
MPWLWFLLCVGGLLVAVAMMIFDGLEHAAVFIFAIVLGFASIFAGAMLTVNAIQRQQTVASCRAWGEQNNRPTRFASYTWWTYECITPDGHGRWVPTTQIFSNVPQR